MPTKNPQKDRQSAAVGYLRRSTEQQEQSIPDQRNAIDRYATEYGIQVIRYYIDDAVTGTQMEAHYRSFYPSRSATCRTANQ